MYSRQSKFLQWINYRIRVTIQDSRMLVGTFLSFDKHMNLVLADTEEFRVIKAKKLGEKPRQQKRALGLVILRGENIVSISAEAPPTSASKRIGSLDSGGIGRAQEMERALQFKQVHQAPPGLAGPARGMGGPMMDMAPPGFHMGGGGPSGPPPGFSGPPPGFDNPQ